MVGESREKRTMEGRGEKRGGEEEVREGERTKESRD